MSSVRSRASFDGVALDCARGRSTSPPASAGTGMSPAQLYAHLPLVGHEPDAGPPQSVHQQRFRRPMKLVPSVLEVPHRAARDPRQGGQPLLRPVEQATRGPTLLGTELFYGELERKSAGEGKSG